MPASFNRDIYPLYPESAGAFILLRDIGANVKVRYHGAQLVTARTLAEQTRVDANLARNVARKRADAVSALVAYDDWHRRVFGGVSRGD